jgi:SAM-dependent methyltransferase
MNPAEYARMFEYEDRYWWFVSRRELVLDQVRRYVRVERPLIVDTGCGTGAMVKDLQPFGQVIGLDFSPLALGACAKRGLGPLLRAKAESIPLATKSVDAIVAMDIVEHLDDDVAALVEFHRILKPGGHAIITVPAYQFLWSEHDVALMHRRRYLAGQLAERAGRAGFERVRLGYVLSFLFPLALGRLFNRPKHNGKPAEAQIKPVPDWLNAALIRLQRAETTLFRFGSLPWGLSVVAVFRKPSDNGVEG